MKISHSRLLPLIFFILCLFYVRLVSAAEAIWFNPCTLSDGLYFTSGFEDHVSVIDSSDGKSAMLSTITAPKCTNSSNPLRNDIVFGKVSIQYEGGVYEERFSKIAIDPLNTNNNTLLFVIEKPNVIGNQRHPAKGRVQMNLYGNQGLRHLKMSVRLFIPPELGILKGYDEKIDWLTISEWWNNAPWTNEMYPFRITVNLFKDLGKGHLFLEVHAQKYISESKKWDKYIWEQVNRDFKIPFGKWMTLEYDYIEGDQNHGKFYLAVTPDGDSRTVIFDVHNYTYHPEDPAPNGLSHLNPLKLYTSGRVINYVNDRGAGLRLHWDDLSLKAISN